jgi:hypothetical protein
MTDLVSIIALIVDAMLTLKKKSFSKEAWTELWDKVSSESLEDLQKKCDTEQGRILYRQKRDELAEWALTKVKTMEGEVNNDE